MCPPVAPRTDADSGQPIHAILSAAKSPAPDQLLRPPVPETRMRAAASALSDAVRDPEPEKYRHNRRVKPNMLGRLSLARALYRRVRLAFRLCREPRVPLLLKLLPLVAAGYVVSPLDLIPDVIPVLG